MLFADAALFSLPYSVEVSVVSTKVRKVGMFRSSATRPQLPDQLEPDHGTVARQGLQKSIYELTNDGAPEGEEALR